MLDYATPGVTSATGTLMVRGVLEERQAPASAWLLRACPRPSPSQPDMLLIPDRVIGSDQGGRYVLVAGKDDVVAQRKVELGQQVADLRVITKGLEIEDRVLISGLMSVVPGQKIEPVMREISGVEQGVGSMISKFFIERPVLANVIAILMVVIGAVAVLRLPVSPVSQRCTAHRPGDRRDIPVQARAP